MGLAFQRTVSKVAVANDRHAAASNMPTAEVQRSKRAVLCAMHVLAVTVITEICRQLPKAAGSYQRLGLTATESY